MSLESILTLITSIAAAITGVTTAYYSIIKIKARKRRHLICFFRTLLELYEATGLVQLSLEMMSEDKVSYWSARLAKIINDQLSNGLMITTIMTQSPNLFDPVLISLMGQAERSGLFEEGLRRVIRTLEEREKV